MQRFQILELSAYYVQEVKIKDEILAENWNPQNIKEQYWERKILELKNTIIPIENAMDGCNGKLEIIK